MSSLIPTEQEMRSLEVIAKNAQQSGFIQNLRSSGAILSIALYARELGLPPMQCLFGGMHSVNGKIELSARMINTLIRKAGHKMEVLESTDTFCSIKGTRKDTSETYTASFSIDDAKIAGIFKAGGLGLSTPPICSLPGRFLDFLEGSFRT